MNYIEYRALLFAGKIERLERHLRAHPNDTGARQRIEELRALILKA